MHATINSARPGYERDETVPIEMDRLWRPVFDRFDHNRSGRVSVEEFRKYLKMSNNEMSEDVTPELLEKIVENADRYKDGYIEYNDFLDLVHDAKLGIERPRVQRIVRYAAMAVVPKSARRSVIRRYLEEYNCMPPPFFILGITFVEIIIYVYYAVILEEFSATGPVPWKSVLIYNPCKRSELWRFFSYVFIHAGFYHIFFNIVIQLLLGVPLEMVHKWWRVGIVYITGAIAGSLASSITDPTSYLAGASGGVYAIIAAHLASVVINWNEMEFNWARLIGLLVFIGSDTSVAIYQRYIRNEVTKVSYSAHFAGALVGFLIGVNALRNLKMHRWEIILGWFMFITYILLMAISIIWNILYPDHFLDPNDAQRCSSNFDFEYTQP